MRPLKYCGVSKSHLLIIRANINVITTEIINKMSVLFSLGLLQSDTLFWAAQTVVQHCENQLSFQSWTNSPNTLSALSILPGCFLSLYGGPEYPNSQVEDLPTQFKIIPSHAGNASFQNKNAYIIMLKKEGSLSCNT